MFVEQMSYTDYDGNQRIEEIRFNLEQAEIMEMQLGEAGGLDEFLKKVINTKDMPTMVKLWKDLVLKAYGVKSADGRKFEKSEEISKDFESTPMYSQMFMRLSTDAEYAVKFIKGIIPQDIAAQITPEKIKETAGLQNFPTIGK